MRWGNLQMVLTLEGFATETAGVFALGAVCQLVLR